MVFEVSKTGVKWCLCIHIALIHLDIQALIIDVCLLPFPFRSNGSTTGKMRVQPLFSIKIIQPPHPHPTPFLTLSACYRFYNQQDNDSCIFLFLKGMKLTLLRKTNRQGGREVGRERAYLIEENKQCKSFLNTFSENIITKTAWKEGVKLLSVAVITFLV